MTTPLPIDSRGERIIAAALDEFARRGFVGAREYVIARRAGVSPLTLRLYFPAKADLFREVVRSTVIETVAADGNGAPDGGNSVERVQAFARSFWTSMDQPEAAALARLAVGELQRFPELALFYATEVVARAANRLEQTLLDGVRRGELRIPDPRTAARIILSALLTHAHWFAFPGTYVAITGPDRERAQESVLTVLGDALRTTTS